MTAATRGAISPPPGTRPEQIGDVYFLDSRRGWALVTEDVTEEALDRWLLYATKDGGETWTPSAFPAQASVEAGGTSIQLDFVDDTHGWVMIGLPSSSQFDRGLLMSTEDGGLSWSEVTAPSGGPINFVDPSTGWIAGGPLREQLIISLDGGASWKEVVVPIPPAFSTSQPTFGAPTFVADSVAMLPVTFTGRRDLAGFAFYRSTDSGATWELPGPVVSSAQRIAPGVGAVADAAALDGWLALDPQRSGHVFVANDRGADVREAAASGLDEGAFLLDVASASTAWAAVSSESCPGKANCVYRSVLLQTEDQGSSWAILSPP